ncbi:MAG: zinc-binding dehydrogenase [Ardenticatenaceae bacterium]
MKVMYAVAFHEHGDPSVLRHQAVALPKLKANDVWIEVKAVALDRRDVWSREGVVGVRHSLPQVPGSNVAGKVFKVGSAVTNVKTGDEVVLHSGISCRNCDMCTSGQEYFCPDFKIYGFHTQDGGYADLVSVPAASLISKPASLSWEEAASVSMPLLAAWHMLVEQANLRPGETVLILGANNSMGAVAIQLAKNVLRAQVIAAVNNEAQAKQAKDLGADHVIDLSEQQIANQIRSITNKRGVNVILGYVDEANLEQSLRSLSPGGKVVLSGTPNGAHANVNLRYLFSKQLSLLGSLHGSKGELLKAMKFVEKGQIKPVVAQTMPLKKAAQAHELMASGDYFGSIVLTP